MIRSISSALTPDRARASRAALTARSPVVSFSAAMRLSRIPVRSTIHSSLVSTIRARSALVMIRAGRYEPTPSITERRCNPDPLLFVGFNRGARRKLIHMFVHFGDVGGDLGDETIADHFDGDVDRRRET